MAGLSGMGFTNSLVVLSPQPYLASLGGGV